MTKEETHRIVKNFIDLLIVDELNNDPDDKIKSLITNLLLTLKNWDLIATSGFLGTQWK